MSFESVNDKRSWRDVTFIGGKIYGTGRRGNKEGLRELLTDCVAFPNWIQAFLITYDTGYHIIASPLPSNPLVSARS